MLKAFIALCCLCPCIHFFSLCYTFLLMPHDQFVFHMMIKFLIIHWFHVWTFCSCLKIILCFTNHIHCFLF